MAGTGPRTTDLDILGSTRLPLHHRAPTGVLESQTLNNYDGDDMENATKQ